MNQATSEQTKKVLRYIPERNKIGAVLRTTDDNSDYRFTILEKAINALLRLEKISLIHVVIYKPQEENSIREKLIKTFGREKKRIQFEVVTSGNFYSDIANFAIGEQIRRGIDYSLIMSSEAHEYANEENLNKILDAAKNGAYAIGLNIKEYSEFIEQGHISNAFCLYRNTVTNFVDVWGLSSLVQDQEQEEKRFGTEELYIVKTFIEKYGYGSLAIVNPVSGKLADLEDEAMKKRRDLIIRTKKDRFQEMSKLLKIDPDVIKSNIKTY